MSCGMQDCVHGASALQGADQGVCFLSSAAHDSWSCPCQHYVHAQGETSLVLAQAVVHTSSHLAHTQNIVVLLTVLSVNDSCNIVS